MWDNEKFTSILYVREADAASTKAMSRVPPTCAICNIDLISKDDRPMWLNGVPLLVESKPDSKDVSIYRGSKCLDHLKEMSQPAEPVTVESSSEKALLNDAKEPEEEEDVIDIHIDDLEVIEKPQMFSLPGPRLRVFL